MPTTHELLITESSYYKLEWNIAYTCTWWMNHIALQEHINFRGIVPWGHNRITKLMWMFWFDIFCPSSTDYHITGVILSRNKIDGSNKLCGMLQISLLIKIRSLHLTLFPKRNQIHYHGNKYILFVIWPGTWIKPSQCFQGFSQDFRIGCPKIQIWGELGVQFFFIPLHYIHRE